AEASTVAERVGKIRTVLRLEALERLLRHDLVERLLDRFRRQLVGPQRRDITVQADARRVAGDEVQVRAALLQHLDQQRIDGRHGLRSLSDRRSRLLRPPRPPREPAPTRSFRPSAAWWCR